MAGLTPEQVQALFAGGHITPGTYTNFFGSSPPPANTNDPFAAGAAQMGIAPKAANDNVPVNPTGIPLGAITPPTFPQAPPGAAPPPPQNALSGSPTPSPQTPKVEGGITLAGTPESRAAANAANQAGMAPPGPKPLYDRKDVDYIASGGAPRMPRGKPPSKQDQAEWTLGRGLTDAEKRDPELLRRILDSKQAHSPEEEAQDRQREAIQKGAEVGQAKAAEEHAAQTYTSALQMGQAAQFQKSEGDRQQAAQKRMQQLNDEADGIAKTKIDDNRLYANQSTGGKILAGILTFFGAASANRGGGGERGNAFVKKMDEDIRRDIETQKANLQNRKDALQQKRGLYAEFLGLTKDAREAELLTYNKYLDAAKSKTLEIAAKYKGPEVQNDADKAVAEMDERIASNNDQRNEMVKQRLAAERAAAAAHAAAIAKEERDHRWELVKTENEKAYGAMEVAQKEGDKVPNWAVKSLGINPTDAYSPDLEGGKISKEARSKRAEKIHEATTSDAADEAAVTELMDSPVVKNSTSGASVAKLIGKAPGGGGLAQRVMPESSADAMSLDAANATINTVGGKATHDTEGRVSKFQVDQLHSFNLKPEDTPAMKVQKLKEFQKWRHDRAAELGARQPRAPQVSADDSDPYSKYQVK